MSDLLKKATKLLDSAATAADLEAVLNHVKERSNAAERERQSISLNPGSWSGPGAERKQVQAVGDVKSAGEMDARERELAAELEVLEVLRNRLKTQMDATLTREHQAAAPGGYADLDELIDAKTEADKAARDAARAVDSKIKELRKRRHHVVVSQRQSYPAADPRLLDRYMAAHGYVFSENHLRTGWFSPDGGNPAKLESVADVLGVSVPGHPGHEQRSHSATA